MLDVTNKQKFFDAMLSYTQSMIDHSKAVISRCQSVMLDLDLDIDIDIESNEERFNKLAACLEMTKKALTRYEIQKRDYETALHSLVDKKAVEKAVDDLTDFSILLLMALKCFILIACKKVWLKSILKVMAFFDRVETKHFDFANRLFKCGNKAVSFSERGLFSYG